MLPRRPILGLLALPLVLAFGACRTECRTLCTDWYDYQRDVCGVVEADDERIRCIADYRARLVTDEELLLCQEEIAELQRVGSLDSPERTCLCDGDRADCPSPTGDAPLGDDDDSASIGDAR